MTFRQAVKEFKNNSVQFSDYWSMQEQWAIFADNLCKNKDITEKQRLNWLNPCTPETFQNWNSRLPKRFSDYELNKRPLE